MWHALFSFLVTSQMERCTSKYAGRQFKRKKKYLVHMNMRGLGARDAIMLGKNPWIINISLQFSIYIFCKYYASRATP